MYSYHFYCEKILLNVLSYVNIGFLSCLLPAEVSPCVLKDWAGLLYNVCHYKIVSLTRKPQCLVPRQARCSFYRPQRDENLSEPCQNPEANLGLRQRNMLTIELRGLKCKDVKKIMAVSVIELFNQIYCNIFLAEYYFAV